MKVRRALRSDAAGTECGSTLGEEARVEPTAMGKVEAVRTIEELQGTARHKTQTQLRYTENIPPMSEDYPSHFVWPRQYLDDTMYCPSRVRQDCSESSTARYQVQLLGLSLPTHFIQHRTCFDTRVDDFTERHGYSILFQDQCSINAVCYVPKPRGAGVDW